jgi:hypothetical protein
MALTGKTGADALAKWVKHQTLLLAHYAVKMDIVINLAVTAGAITSGEAALIRAYIAAMQAAAAAIQKLADFSGFNTNP